jgi:hypothetical protein
VSNTFRKIGFAQYVRIKERQYQWW